VIRKMAKPMHQKALFPYLTVKFPSTRYQGSKAKLVEWIWGQIHDLEFSTCLDAFSGTCAVAYKLKCEGKQVTSNDILRFNYYLGVALVENSDVKLEEDEVDWILHRHSNIKYPSVVERNFHDIYFTDEENVWIDQAITNIKLLENPFKFTLAFFALCQACIIKRPFNLFHRKNLYIRFAEVERSFGNKTTWDKPFEFWFRIFVEEANRAVFDNKHKNRALNFDANDIPGEYDLVYIDTPYISKRGIAVDYRGFYHFLEGLAMYDKWEENINRKSRHRCLKVITNDWTDKRRIHSAFNRLFKRFKDSILVVSYRSDGIPSESELTSLLKRYKECVRAERYGKYKYVLSKNSRSEEILLIAM